MGDISQITPDGLLSPEGLPATVRLVLLLSALSLAPSLLMLATCFVRIVVVLGLLRQGLGMQQLLPNPVITGLSLFLTATIMWPVWTEAYEQGVRPYAEGTYTDEAARKAAFDSATQESLRPLRKFLCAQIEATGNEAAIDLFLEYQQPEQTAAAAYPQFYEDVPLTVLLPAYVVSELKTAFLIGFQIYLPFVVIDLVCAALLSGMGLTTVQPSVVSLPLKLLLFVLADGWFLTVQLLLGSIHTA
jgi:flagellar biosynthetic protein FliP